MGSESVCQVELDGTFAEAKALLETEELVVRSPFRVKVPFRDFTLVNADDETLILKWPGHSLRLEIGREARKWADKIRNPKSVADKIGVKAGQRIALVGTLDATFVADLKCKGAVVDLSLRAKYDIIFLAADRTSALQRLRTLHKSLVSSGAIWVIRPKGSDAISERDVMDAGKRAGLVDVKVVRFSESHTAEKLVIPVTKR
jgi:hypothetical protein